MILMTIKYQTQVHVLKLKQQTIKPAVPKLKNAVAQFEMSD